MESQKLAKPQVHRELQKMAVVMHNSHLKWRNIAGLIRQARMGTNTASIAARKRAPNQSTSVVIFTPGGSI
jgi:hypothetical protein